MCPSEIPGGEKCVKKGKLVICKACVDKGRF